MKNDDLPHSKKGEEVWKCDEKWWFVPLKKGRGRMGMWWKMMICPIQKRMRKYGNVMENDDLSHSKRGSMGMWWKMTICTIQKEEVWECDKKCWFASFKKGRGSLKMWWKIMICPIQKKERKYGNVMKNDDLPHSKKRRRSMGMWWKMMICPILKRERKYENEMKNDDLPHSKKGEELWECDEKW